MKICIKKGLDIPLDSAPSGSPQLLATPEKISLNLDSFADLRFKILVRVGDFVKIGQPLVENKSAPGMIYASPACGQITEIRRGLKRKLVDLVISVSEKEQMHTLPAVKSYTKEAVLERLLQGGGLAHIRSRPFDLTAHPARLPKAIFVKAIESSPFTPPAAMQLEGHEELFAMGLKGLKAFAPVHLVYREGETCSSFTNAKDVETHQIKGPHPAGNASIHIHHICPITHHKEIIWTLAAADVITVGMLLAEGAYYTRRVIGLGGGALKEGAAGFFKGRLGHSISALLADRVRVAPHDVISGDPLTGTLTTNEGFLGFSHTALSLIPLPDKREPLHFLRLGGKKFSATRTYLSGFLRRPRVSFTTSQHGEERAFIDQTPYSKVMPMRIPTMLLVKAVLCEDFDLAEKLGLLEISPEDFALPTFICPSKIDMMEIIKRGLHQYAKELGY